MVLRSKSVGEQVVADQQRAFFCLESAGEAHECRLAHALSQMAHALNTLKKTAPKDSAESQPGRSGAAQRVQGCLQKAALPEGRMSGPVAEDFLDHGPFW